jgi:hypothetical protein
LQISANSSTITEISGINFSGATLDKFKDLSVFKEQANIVKLPLKTKISLT